MTDQEGARQSFYKDYVEGLLLRQAADQNALSATAQTMMDEMSTEELMTFIGTIVSGKVAPEEFSPTADEADDGPSILRRACAAIVATAAGCYPYSARPALLDEEPA